MALTLNIDDAPLMLGVSGVRGLVGRTMTPAIAADFAAAYGTFVAEGTGGGEPLVCIGRDSRPSGEMLAASATAGLIASGCRVVDLGVVATPTIAVMIGQRRAAAGLAVTASHNPIAWNGIKCLDGDGLAPPAEVAEAVVERFRRRAITYAPVEALCPLQRDDRGHRAHVERVLAAADGGPVRRAGFRVVLDSVNGAGGAAGRRLLEALGCTVIHLNGEPTGRFAHEPEPLAANLTDLAARTAAAGAACGFAQDPDADRLAVVDERGRYLGEEYTLALAARILLARDGGGVMVSNLSTSRMLDDLAAGCPGASVVRTAVGEANVAGVMRARGAMVGGEGNGGVILPAVCWVRDSLSGMALVLSLLAQDGRPLSAIVGEMPRYAMIKRKIDLAAMGGPDAAEPCLARIARRFRGRPLSTVDGVRVDFEGGWVHVRPSNTEPILRVIAEARTPGEAAALADEVAGDLGRG